MKRLLVIFGTLLLILFIFTYLYEFEIVDSKYYVYEEAFKNKDSSNEWLPRYLPKSSYDIYERHDIDTNEVWIFFRFKNYFLTEISGYCVQESSDKLVLPNKKKIENIKWWPEKFNNRELLTNKKSLVTLKCQDNSYMVVDSHEKDAVYWSFR